MVTLAYMKNLLENVKDKLINVHPLLVIVPLSLLLLLNISKQYLWTDEVFSYTAAQMIVEKGEPLYDAGLKYLRAPIYHQTLALSFKIFSETILTSRAINVLFSFVTSAFLYKILKDRNKNAGILAAAIFLTTNFTLAVVRETRMYAMTAMFLTSSIYFLYNSVKALDLRKTIIANINRATVLNTLAGALLLYLTYNTHPSTGAVGVGILIFLTIWAVQQKSMLLFQMLALTTLFFLAAIYFQYSTLNPSELFERINPDWANENFSRIYYSILIFRNLPIFIAAVPLIIYSVLVKKNLLTLFSSSLAFGYLAVMSNQPAQQERYIFVIIPLLIIAAVETITSINWKKILSPVMFKTLAALLSFTLLFHVFLYIKEQREITSYTPTSISIHKKFEFEKAMEVLDQYNPDTEIIADYHSAFTLHFYGYNVKKILVPLNHPDLKRGDTDIYFNIPFVTYGQELEKEIADSQKDVLVIRDITDLESLNKKDLQKLPQLSEPVIYEEL